MFGVNNAAEDDQATVRPTSLACAAHAPPISERGDAGKALARWGGRCCFPRLPNARRGHWSRLVHHSATCARELEGDRTLGASIVRARRRDRAALRSLRRTRARPRADDGRAARSQHADDLAARRLKPRDRHGRRPALDVHGVRSSCLLPAGCRAARSRCGKAARPTENNRGTPSG